MTEENTNLITMDAPQLAALFKAPEALDAVLDRIEEEARAHVADLTTKKGRDAIASMAYKVSRSKSALDDAGKRLVEDIKKQTGKVDAERKKARDRLDKLRDEVRKPLTEWEDAEEARKDALRARMRAFVSPRPLHAMSSADLIGLRDVTSAIEVGDDWQELKKDAGDRKQAFLADLDAAITIARDREERDAEIARLRAEAEARANEEAARLAAQTPPEPQDLAVEGDEAPEGMDAPEPEEAAQPGGIEAAQPDPDFIRVIDYETTGTPEDGNAEVVEAAYVDLHEVFGMSDGWASLCKPIGPVPPVARAVHHITDDELMDAPPAYKVFETLLDGINPDSIMAAHNADFEKHFTPDRGQRWICTYKCARVVWPDAPSHSNQALRYWLGLDDDKGFVRGFAMPPHRALPDAYVTAFLLARLLREKSVAELIHISKFPALLKVMNFGKHKGMTFQDAPTDYLEWIRDKSDMDADTKFTAGYWLKKRREASHAQ